jgi:hypothetical protein
MQSPTYALVTGASRGIGEHFARALAARKQNLVLVARSQGKLESLAGELRASHAILVEPLAFDLTSPEAVARLTSTLRERGLTIDLLVNNAGLSARGQFWDLPLDRQLEMIRLNAGALVALTYHLLPPMIERRRGGIINVSSLTSFQPLPYVSIYAATKAFVTTFSMALAEEVRPLGISVVTLCPGRTRTVAVGQDQRGGQVLGGLQPAEEVVEAALQALARRQGLVVPRFLNQFALFVQRFLPRDLTPKLAARLSRR